MGGTDVVRERLGRGLVIPACPLALTAERKFDERRQRALFRYYHAAGAGGLAVGVHTTQFAIRDSRHALLRPVLELAAETSRTCDFRESRDTVRIAGICGRTEQAMAEAGLARELGYDAGLLSLAALKTDSDDELIAHCRRVAEVMPLFGFYLQPAAGGRILPLSFWRRFVEIDNVVGIKIAPFNRYQTLEVVRAVAESGRAGEIALYTGNDDTIVMDLLTEFRVPEAYTETVVPSFAGTLARREPRVEIREAAPATIRIVGGLLGHWACWTHAAVRLFDEICHWRTKEKIPAELLAIAAQVTDCNAAIFDAANQFAGCIPGIHEVLRRQGLLEGTWCLEPNEALSAGQADEIERVCRDYPQLTDDTFVREHLDEWLNG